MRVAASLQRVKNDPVLVAFLVAETDEALNQLALQRDEVAFRQLQGKVQYLLELRELVEKSAAIAAKLGA